METLATIILAISILCNAKDNAEYEEIVDTLSGEKSTIENVETENTIISNIKPILCIICFCGLFLCAWMYEEIKNYRIRTRLLNKRVRLTKHDFDIMGDKYD